MVGQDEVLGQALVMYSLQSTVIKKVGAHRPDCTGTKLRKEIYVLLLSSCTAKFEEVFKVYIV